MSEGKITCVGCGKLYAWKPDFAGKKVRCKCGAVFIVANELLRRELDAEAQELRGAKTADLPPPPDRNVNAADETTPPNVCPNCYQDIAADAVVCLECGYNRETGEKVGAVPAISDHSDAAAARSGSAPAPGAMRKIIRLFKRRPKAS